ncbi:Uncharacterized protein SCG7086_AQ_00110 [Chlamydiales bacterium SCGC AG-110-P3]|nr:Uncharacterized protein SCG7086_AQ_00110 [Chlamydiales bacterium SCGC AG-110-P3]
MSTLAFKSITSHIDRMALENPEMDALVVPTGKRVGGETEYTHLSFKELKRESEVIAAGLIKAGISKGSRTVLMLKPSLDFFVLTFAALKAGIVPIMIDPGLGVKNLKTCLQETHPEAFIGISKAHVARILFRWSKDSIKTLVTSGRRYFWGGYSLEDIKKLGRIDAGLQAPQIRPEDIAAILFTSGSTGVPKGVVYQHKHLVAQVEMIKKTYNIKPGEIDLPTFPFFALFDPALGMTAVIPNMDPTRPAKVDPRNLLEPIRRFNITNMFGSPALLNTFGRYCEKHTITLPSLKRIISAGEAVSPTVLDRFKHALSSTTEIYTPYGATESLPVSSIGSHEILEHAKKKTEQGAGTCVGKAVDSMEIAIIAIDDKPIEYWNETLQLQQGEIGEIVVKGPPVTSSYYNRTASTQLAKIKDGKTIRHRMGDLGYFDREGNLWFCGRKGHRVETENKCYYSVPCEGIFNVHPLVYRSALVSLTSDGAITPGVCIELKNGKRSAKKDELFKELRTIGSSYDQTKDIQYFFIHPGFPVDIRHNSKISRERLSRWAQKELR